MGARIAIGGYARLRKLYGDLFTHLKTVLTYRRTHHDPYVFGRSARLHHNLYGPWDYPRHSAAPSRMDGSRNSSHGIKEYYRHTVGGIYSYNKVAPGGDDAVHPFELTVVGQAICNTYYNL